MDYYPTTLTVRFASLQINSVRRVIFPSGNGINISCNNPNYRHVHTM